MEDADEYVWIKAKKTKAISFPPLHGNVRYVFVDQYMYVISYPWEMRPVDEEEQ